MAASDSTPNNTTIHQGLDALSLLMEYPALVHHEEQMIKSPYHVSGWSLYMDLLDEMLTDVSEYAVVKNQEKVVVLGDRAVRVGDHPQIHKDLCHIRIFVGQRAVQLLPGSYKLWRSHLLFQMKPHNNASSIPHAHVLASFEDCFKRLHKMPRLWMDYLEYVQRPEHFVDVTYWRRLVNRALMSLPVTQHTKLWAVVIPVFDRYSDTLPSETIVRMLRRYCMLEPTFRVDMAQRCVSMDRPAEAALLYLELLNDSTTLSTQKFDLWMAFSDLVCHHPMACRHVGINFEALVRGALFPQKGIEEINDIHDDDDDENPTSLSTSASSSSSATKLNLGEMEGTLWAKLASYFVRLGEFEMARSIYEEAMEAVSRVRDFAILFDAYSQLEEGILELAMANATNANSGDDDDEAHRNDKDDNNEADENEAPTTQRNDDMDILLGNDADKTTSATADMEWALSRAEHLAARRPLLLNRVLLKQNPHNVGEWMTRSQLYVKQGQINMAVTTLQESLTRVHANKAVNGSPSQLVLELVRIYEEELQSVDKARELLKRICEDWGYRFRHVEDMAACHAAWIELELRHEQWEEALSLARQAVSPPAIVDSANAKIAKALPKSLRLWDLLLDLEESLGTVSTTKDAYNRAMELKVATPMHVLNYCSFLKDKKYFEESFGAYERGLDLFQFPGAKVLWLSYLQNFIERYQGTKVERVRDLFDRCLESCPADDLSEFYLLNGEFEEQHGLTRRALGVYKAMCQKVPDTEKFTAYQLYIAKTTKYLGLTATRDVYQEAIATLQDDQATAKLCLDFAQMESSLQEVDRARGVLTYGAQMADPRRNPEYWTAWHEFEVSHGNEETFREMLRIKRSVQASFSTVNYNATDVGSSLENLDPEQALELIANQEGVDFEDDPSLRKHAPIQGFVQQKRPASSMAGLGDIEERVAKLRKAAQDDDEEIDIDDLDDDDDQDKGGSTEMAIKNVSTKQVPDAVFGGLAVAANKEP